MGTLQAVVRDLFDDERLTAMGLLLEAHAGLTAAFMPQLAELGLPGPSFEVLLRLARSPGGRLRMTELAAQSTLTTSGLTRLVDRLEERGLVRREPCETDRRGFFTVLTPAGRRKVARAVPPHLETVDRILTGVLEPAELDALLHALRKVRAVVKPGADPARRENGTASAVAVRSVPAAGAAPESAAESA
ncbi:MAG: transcriptional regulator MarR family [Acidimicrobiales bacterium]|nr:transcriptional regulator MarR family [Acidimicrobiales bacterium]